MPSREWIFPPLPFLFCEDLMSNTVRLIGYAVLASLILGYICFSNMGAESVELKKSKVRDIIQVESKYDLSKAEYSERVIRGVTITSYNNDINQTDDTPNVTASNRPVREGMVAVSRDFLSYAKYGDLIYVDCFDRWFIVDDTMNKRFTKRVDIFLFDRKESLKINKKCDIKIVHITK